MVQFTYNLRRFGKKGSKRFYCGLFDQRHLIFDIHYLFWFLTGVSLAARAITW